MSVKFTSRHYQALGEALQKGRELAQVAGGHSQDPMTSRNAVIDLCFSSIVAQLDTLFSQDNPAYNSHRFHAYLDKLAKKEKE
jgi:hypothetical protein